MLSKSQARLFFLAATVGFAGVFLWLTVDTILQLPERTNEDQLSEAVVRGKEIWEENNCMGCHTILGEGAYYAPELTKVVDRRGDAWIRVFLKDPEAMFPGERRMVKYDFSEGDIDALLAFFTWIGNIDTNGFPAEPDLAPPSTTAAGATAALDGAPPVYSQLCAACHAVGGKGGVVGPALDGIGKRFDKAWMVSWLRDPATIRPGTTMPKLPLTDDQIDGLSTWLSQLQ